MSNAAWVAFLDTLESELHAVQRAGTGSARPPDFAPPIDLGPLPRDLADRARAVLGSIERTADAVRADMARTSKQLRELRHLDPRGPKPASSVDLQA